MRLRRAGIFFVNKPEALRTSPRLRSNHSKSPSIQQKQLFIALRITLDDSSDVFRCRGSTAKPVLGRALFALFSALFGASEWQKGLGPSRLSLDLGFKKDRSFLGLSMVRTYRYNDTQKSFLIIDFWIPKRQFQTFGAPFHTK